MTLCSWPIWNVEITSSGAFLWTIHSICSATNFSESRNALLVQNLCLIGRCDLRLGIHWIEYTASCTIKTLQLFPYMPNSLAKEQWDYELHFTYNLVILHNVSILGWGWQVTKRSHISGTFKCINILNDIQLSSIFNRSQKPCPCDGFLF